MFQQAAQEELIQILRKEAWMSSVEKTFEYYLGTSPTTDRKQKFMQELRTASSRKSMALGGDGKLSKVEVAKIAKRTPALR